MEIVRRKWLEGENKDKIEIALAMNEVFPCDSREEMNQLFQRIIGHWPEFQQSCQEILDRWDEQYSYKPPEDPEEHLTEGTVGGRVKEGYEDPNWR